MTAQELNQSLKEIHYHILLKLQEANAAEDEDECLGEGCDEEGEDNEYEEEDEDYYGDEE